MSTPAVSVILPTRHRPHLLPRAVASVFSQTETDFELLVIDDNDPARRPETVRALAAWITDSRLRVIPHDQPAGVSAARNVGLASARGEWITYLDDDDAYAPAKVASQLACARRTGAPLVLCGLRYHLGARTRVRQGHETWFAGAAVVLEAQAAAPALFHRRDDSVRFDETLGAGEDQDFFLQLVARWALDGVPNVGGPLVDVYPQSVGLRVNAPSPALRRAQRMICLRHARRYGREVQRMLVARTALVQQRGRSGGWHYLWRASVRLLRIGGVRECRLILNTWALRLPGVRRLVVT